MGIDMKEIILEGGIKVRTFRPPHGFDPLLASSDDLQKFGFPPRPDDPDRLARYRKRWGRLSRLRYIEPTFRVDKEIVHGPRRRLEGFQSSPNWSGSVVYAPLGTVLTTFTYVNARWVVPNVYTPADNISWCGWCNSSSWVGIDGDGTTGGEGGDVLQAGVDCNVSTVTPIRNIHPFWQWWPGLYTSVTNFPVSAGDEISVQIQATGPVPYAAANICFSNDAAGIYTIFNVTAPEGKNLVGNCAEWIVERPGTPGTTPPPPPLAVYGDIYFSDCEAETDDYTSVAGGTGDDIQMDDDAYRLELSIGNGIVPGIIRCHYTGPMIHTWPNPYEREEG
jgi:hypothetical protein